MDQYPDSSVPVYTEVQNMKVAALSATKASIINFLKSSPNPFHENSRSSEIFPASKKPKSRFPCVWWDCEKKSWRAVMVFHGSTLKIGRFENFERHRMVWPIWPNF